VCVSMMRKDFSRVQVSKLVWAFCLVLMFLTVLYFTTVYIAFGSFIVVQLVLIINLLLASIGGWYLYMYRYHTKFSFDNLGFSLEVGKREKVTKRWSDFNQVSLVNVAHGEFVVRLYNTKTGDLVDLPVSAVKLDPSSFRFEVMRLVGEASVKRS